MGSRGSVYVDVDAKEMTSILVVKVCWCGALESESLVLVSMSRVSFYILLNIYIENAWSHNLDRGVERQFSGKFSRCGCSK
mgnify:CR=1 FL=1